MGQDDLLQGIVDTFDSLAQAVAASPSVRLDPLDSDRLRGALESLRQFIPGIDVPPDAEAARCFLREARSAASKRDTRAVAELALRGLSFAPHHPELMYHLAMAFHEHGSDADAILLLQHADWLRPNHPQIKHILDPLLAQKDEPNSES